ncbi:alpha/beta hydrolase family protein [Streptosporangium sp. NPDC000396]|uniref:alpha/beta hydrolase family protein n=1 Tax=Streptosporangium sp. NPDC000396 TaxID=3366185 RepID=UPI0036CFFC12
MTETIAGPGMSPLEILIVLGAVVLALARWSPPGARRPLTLAAAAVVVSSGATSIVLGLRWQLIPALAGAAITLPFTVPSAMGRRAGRPGPRPRRWPALVGAAASLCLTAAGAAAAWALPVPVFPEPSGRYAVGTTVTQWTDPSRPETATTRPDDKRTVVVQLWYPARTSPASAERARYLGRTEREARTVARGLAAYLGMPGFLPDSAPRARTHSVFDAPVAGTGGRFPLVLFSPGLGGVRTQNTAWAEELASRGYVVAALDHPYDSATVVLSDGQTINTRLAATGDPAEDEKRAAGWTAVRAADLSFALTQLGRLDSGEIRTPLAGRLDTGRAAATGHSLGGAAALQAARQDPRFSAVINLDGFPRDPAPRPFQQPVLALTHPLAPGESPTYIPRLTQVLKLSTTAGYHLTVPGTAHLTFTDAPLYLPPLPGLVGSLGRTEGSRITAAVTAAFLDTTLKNQTGDLAAHLSPYGDLSMYHAGKKIPGNSGRY